MLNVLATQAHPAAQKVCTLLRKIDALQLPPNTRQDIESILARQASKEIDRALPWQAGHGRRSAVVAVQLGHAAGLDAKALHQLKLAALLHDVGLLVLPRTHEFRETLSQEGYLMIQNHSRLGGELLESFSFLREAATFVAHHHERWDGSGYPYGLRGSFIPLGSRILSIADAFDAIRVPNVTSRGERDRVALRILRVSAGTQFDPGLVEWLCTNWDGFVRRPSTCLTPPCR